MLPAHRLPHSSLYSIFALGVILVLAGCSGWTNPVDKLRPYKLDIQQGNAVTQEMLDKLKPGMTPAQVRFILGTPLIVDPFHPERWDYVYTHSQMGKATEQRRVAVVFENQKLKGVEGDVVATQSAPAPISSTPNSQEAGK